MDGIRAKAASDDPGIRSSAASSPLIDEPTAWHLSRDPAGQVRGWLARNSHVPAAVLYRLAQDQLAVVRGHVAWNKSTPQEIVLMLANDPDSSVQALAQTVLDNA